MYTIQTGDGQTRHCLRDTGENTQVADGREFPSWFWFETYHSQVGTSFLR